MKTSFTIFTIALLTTLAITGCAVQQGTHVEARDVSFVKKGVTTKAELVDKLGPPTTVTIGSSKRETLVWEHYRHTTDAKSFIPFVGLLIGSTEMQGSTFTVQLDKHQRVRIPVAGMLKVVIERIVRRKRTFTVQPLALLVDDKGRALTKFMLRSRFEKARAAAGPEAANFQFRDLRAKAASDLRDQAGLEAAQSLLGHASVTMTEHYTRNRLGKVADVVPEGRWKGNINEGE